MKRKHNHLCLKTKPLFRFMPGNEAQKAASFDPTTATITVTTFITRHDRPVPRLSDAPGA